MFTTIIDKINDGEVTYWSSLYGFVVWAFATLFTGSSMLLIPQHNVIKMPEYWYEILFSFNFGYVLISVLSAIFQWSTVINVNYIKSVNAFWILLFSSGSACTVTYLFIYVMWVHILEYQHPIQFVGYICGIISQIALYAAVWFYYLLDWRSNDECRKRLRFYLFYNAICVSVSAVNSVINSLFTVIPTHLQWMLAFILPIIRHIIAYVRIKLGYKAAGGKYSSVKFAISLGVGSSHAFFLAILVGSAATWTTSYLIQGIDFVLHLYLCINVIRLNSSAGSMENDKKVETPRGLVLSETIEMLVPLTYCSSLLIAYYGPNAEIFGNIQNSYWHYKKIDNVWKTLSKISVFLVSDILSVSVSGVLLWKFCKINLIKSYCNMMNEHWLLMSIVLANSLAHVCYYVILRPLLRFMLRKRRHFINNNAKFLIFKFIISFIMAYILG